VFVVALATFAVQTVGWVECCCVLICKHHNNPCKDECKEPPKADDAHDCCKKPASKAPAHHHDQRCSHVEPSSEIVSQTADVQVDLPAIILELPLPEILPPHGVETDLPIRAARGSPPLLHLLYGTLLI